MLKPIPLVMKRLLNPRLGGGLTLIECLVAIFVIALVASLITPAVILAVGTRVQGQRAEQALQVAQAEIDQIRLLVERGGDYSTEIGVFPVTTGSVTTVGAPTAFAADLDSTTTATAKEVNVDGDTDPEFAVQVYRTEGLLGGSPSVPIAFEVGVRVYDHRAASNNLGALLTDAASLSLTSGEGERGQRPLAVLYTNILQGDREGALCQYWQYIDSTASTAGVDCS